MVDGLGELIGGRFGKAAAVALPPIQLACGDPEGGLPHPSVGRLDLVPSCERLRERFSDGIARDRRSPLNPTKARHRRADSRS